MIETYRESGEKEWIEATVTIDGTTINLQQGATLSVIDDASGPVALANGATINVGAGGVLDFPSLNSGPGRGISSGAGTGQKVNVNFGGSIQNNAPGTSFIDVPVDNSATIANNSGILMLNGGGFSFGQFTSNNVAGNITFNGSHTLDAGGNLTGIGDIFNRGGLNIVDALIDGSGAFENLTGGTIDFSGTSGTTLNARSLLNNEASRRTALRLNSILHAVPRSGIAAGTARHRWNCPDGPSFAPCSCPFSRIDSVDTRAAKNPLATRPRGEAQGEARATWCPLR